MIEVVHTVYDTWMVLVNGWQHGGVRDSQGAGTLTFPTLEEATEYANTLELDIP